MKHAGPATAHDAQNAKHTPDKLKLTFSPDAKVFYIDGDAQMPEISVTCELPSAAGNAPAARTGADKTAYEWTVTLELDPRGVPFAAGRRTSHPRIKVFQASPTLKIPFTAVRGGTLTVSVSTTVSGKVWQGTAVAEVLGTNPSLVALRSMGVPDVLAQLMTVETTTRSQFLPRGHKSGYPLFSQDGLGGVGLGQITIPRPTDDEVWSWKANVKAALVLFATKKAEARKHFTSYLTGPTFQQLVKAYNDERVREGAKSKPPVVKRPLVITLPDPTASIVEDETIRRYNGEPVIPEYVPLQQNGLLVVQEQPGGTSGLAQWHQVTTAERIAAYDASAKTISQNAYDGAGYVEKVRAVVLQ